MALKGVLVGAALAVSVAALAQEQDGAEEETPREVFTHPEYGRYRLDYCLFENIDCGIGAANRFCTREGYYAATEFRPDYIVDATVRLGDRSECHGRECVGFDEIVCEGEGTSLIRRPESVRPVRPTWDENEGDGE